MKGTTDPGQLEQLASLQTALQELIARSANDGLSAEERESAKLGSIDLANQICEMAKQGDSPVYIINILPKRHLCTRTYASYWIHGTEEGQQYAATVIAPATGWRDAGFGGEPFSVRGVGDAWRPKGSPLYYRARVVATDLCREVNGDLPSLQSVDISQANSQGARLRKTEGVFMSDTRVPEKKALDKEISEVRTYFQALVSEGSLIWEQSHDYRRIGSMHHMAARYLKIETGWHEDFLSRMACPGCGEQVRSNVAMCGKCGWIINEQAVRDQAALATRLGVDHTKIQRGARAGR